MFRYRRNSKGMYDNLDDPGGFPIREQDLDILRRDNIPFEVIEDKPRMAGELFSEDDRVQMLIDLEEAASAPERELSPAYERLVSRFEEFNKNDQALIDAGVKPSSMPGGMQRLQTGTLRGGVPGPYIKGKPDNETRVLLDKDETGELIPIDTITFGQHKQLPGGHTKAAEYLGEKILRLMDMEPELLNTKASYYADLIDKKTGKRIDVEIKDNDPGQHSGAVFPQQVYTNLFPLDGRSRKPYQIRADVERMVNDYAMFHNVNMIDAVEALIKKGDLGPSDQRFRVGKALKSDPRIASSEEARMDSIIMPGYTRETNQIGVSGGNEGSLVTAPTSIQEINLPLALEYVKQQKGNLEPRKKLRTRDSRGDEQMQDKEGHLRARLYMDIPNDATIGGKQIADNVLEIHPLTQQLLARSELKKRYEK